MTITTLLSTLLFFHEINSIQNFGETIELEDHSRWQVASTDIYKTVSWDNHEQVVLTPNTSWFSFYRYDYYLTNLSRESYIRVNLIAPPELYSTGSHWISSIDKFGGFAFLNNGESWKLHPSDIAAFQEWSLNDHIIYGQNDQPNDPFDHLLINVRLKKHVRAQQF